MKIDEEWITKIADTGFILLYIVSIPLLLTISYKNEVTYFFFGFFVAIVVYLSIIAWIETKAIEEVYEEGEKNG